MPMSKEQIAEVLETIATLLELKGENPFKVRAYHNAIRALESFSGDLAKMAAEDRLTEISGIGESLAEKIKTLLTDGRLGFYETLKAEFPPGLFEFFGIHGLGPKKIKAIFEILKISDVPA